MLDTNFPQQSNQADWTESIQLLSEDDGQPLWTSVPSDLVVSLVVKAATRRGMGDVQVPYLSQQTLAPLPVIDALSTDGSGQVAAYESGVIQINVPAPVMMNLTGGFYEVFMTMKTQGRTMQLIRGMLPLIWGG